MVFTIQLAKDQHSLPLTRDDMVGWERTDGAAAARAAEQGAASCTNPRSLVRLGFSPGSTGHPRN